MYLKISSERWQPFYHSLNVLIKALGNIICMQWSWRWLLHSTEVSLGTSYMIVLHNLNLLWKSISPQLTHCGLVTPYNDMDRNGSTLVQVMACCLMAPSHYLNHCLLIILGVLWHSPGNNVTRDYLSHWFLKYIAKISFPGANGLTHWGRDKMASNFLTTFSNAFSWMKIYKFRLRFHWSFVPKGPINNIPALVQIMAWRRPGDKPLSEPMMVCLLTHIWVTRPQWVKSINPKTTLLATNPTS